MNEAPGTFVKATDAQTIVDRVKAAALWVGVELIEDVDVVFELTLSGGKGAEPAFAIKCTVLDGSWSNQRMVPLALVATSRSCPLLWAKEDLRSVVIGYLQLARLQPKEEMPAFCRKTTIAEDRPVTTMAEPLLKEPAKVDFSSPGGPVDVSKVKPRGFA